MRPHVAEFLARWLGEPAAAVLTPTWFTFPAIAVLLTAWLSARAARRAGLDATVVLQALLIGYIAALGAGILMPMIIEAGAALGRGDGLRLRWAGMTSFWGFGGALIAVTLYLRRGPLVPARFADLVAAPLGLAIAVTRLGCFVGGCDFGKVTSLPWAVRFPRGSSAWHDHVHSGVLPAWREASLPVHPTQLYEAGLGLVLFATAILVGRSDWARRRHGRVFLVVLAGYALGRFLIENLRGDAGRGLFGPVSSGQIFAVLLLAGAVALLWRGRQLIAAAVVAAVVVTLPSGLRAEEPPRPPLRFEADLTLTSAMAINRREDQVPLLGGASLGGAVVIAPRLAFGLELDSIGNSVATHSAGLLTVSLRWPVAPSVTMAGKLGVGLTELDFREPAFDDELASGFRAGLDLDIMLSDRFALVVRPITFDLTASADIGGPLLTYQFRVGLGYRTGSGPARTPAAAPPAPAPSGPPGAGTVRW